MAGLGFFKIWMCLKFPRKLGKVALSCSTEASREQGEMACWERKPRTGYLSTRLPSCMHVTTHVRLTLIGYPVVIFQAGKYSEDLLLM